MAWKIEDKLVLKRKQFYCLVKLYEKKNHFCWNKENKAGVTVREDICLFFAWFAWFSINEYHYIEKKQILERKKRGVKMAKINGDKDEGHRDHGMEGR